MARTIIDVNILHTVPPSNINRDDTGSPKSAIYGGVRRARVSSQAWKRATRLAFNEFLDPSRLGVRTKRVVELVGERIVEKDPDVGVERSQELSKLVFAAAGIKLSTPRSSKNEPPKPDEAGYLLFLSSRQIDQLAEAALEANATDDAATSLKGAELKKKLDREHSVDIALFGRMVAEAADLNVDAAAQVAHAISVHAVENEFDYYTAVDDHKAQDDEEDAGAGMIGTVEFNSSTLYRYATIDVDRLRDNLGDADATRSAVEVFLQAFITSLPTGKLNTFANRTLPDAVVVSIRETQSVNLVGAFEEAIESDRIREAAKRLAAHAKSIDDAFGTTPIASWLISTSDATLALEELGEKVRLAELIERVGATVAGRLTVTE